MKTLEALRAELLSGKRAPSMRTVQRHTQAVGAQAVVRLDPA
jgi:uncharacterized protein YbjQ (UPF0145 family)